MVTFADQADTGAATYTTNCGACHGAELQGSALGPMLSGGGFLGSYGRQSPYEFFNFLKSNMPPGGNAGICLLYTSPSPRDMRRSRMPSSA